MAAFPLRCVKRYLPLQAELGIGGAGGAVTGPKYLELVSGRGGGRSLGSGSRTCRIRNSGIQTGGGPPPSALGSGKYHDVGLWTNT